MNYKDIIWVLINLIILYIFIYISRKLYFKQKYFSGKKFIWSKDDQENKKLIGYHAYEKPLMPLIVAIIGFSRFIRDYSVFMANLLKVIFWLLIIYVIVSFTFIEREEKKQNFQKEIDEN